MIEKTTKIISLFDFYQELLTKKQREYFECYYEDDLSFSEVAEKYGVSRNAVHDNLKRTVAALENYEEKLSLYEKYVTKSKLIEEIKETNNLELLDVLEEL